MSKPKKRKFQILPNSLTPAEENATRNVLRRLRNPSTDLQAEAVPPPPPPVDSAQSKTVDSTKPVLVESSVDSTAPANLNLVDSSRPPIETGGVHQKQAVDSRKADRHSKNKIRIQPRIDKGIYRRIKAYCAKSGIELGDFIESLAVHHLDLVESTKRAGAESTDDKMIIFRSNSLVINLYETLTKKNRWTWNDDKEAVRFSEDQIEAIEVAMIRTILRAKQQIRTFKYFIPEIELELAMNVAPEVRQIQLASARKLLEMHRSGISVDA